MKPPTRAQMDAARSVLEWLASGDQDPGARAAIDETRTLIDVLIEVGW